MTTTPPSADASNSFARLAATYDAPYQSAHLAAELAGAYDYQARESGAYAYQARELLQPTPAQVRAARLLCGQTQAAAAALVHKSDSAQWRAWERMPNHAGRAIDLAIWELYLIKSGLRVNPIRESP